jgi:flagellar assembly protein FliH
MSISATLVAKPESKTLPAAWLRSTPGTAQVCDFVLPAAENTGSASIEREAYDRGFADGQRSASEVTAAAVAARVARLSAAISEISSLRTGLLRSSEQDIVRLSLAIARRILGREATSDPALLLNLARAASAKLAGTGVISIEMHPTEFAAISAGLDQNGPIRVVENPDLPVGGCMVCSASGSIDVSIEVQVQEIANALLTDEPSR